MPRFFVSKEDINTDANTVTVRGDDAFHISRSLRMAAGEHITVCDGAGKDYDCILAEFSETVTAKIVSATESVTEPPFSVILYQALPKGDKLDTVIQKSVECGAAKIELFESEHCIVKYDPRSDGKKGIRRNRIAVEASKQSGRGVTVNVGDPMPFDVMLEKARNADLPLFCYEGNGTVSLGEIIRKTEFRKGMKITVVIGPEGGFSEKEANLAKDNGFIMTGLGKRILRTETVSSFVLGALVCSFEL